MTRTPEESYDAVLVVGFGGPEKKEDVIPFLENVLRGKNVPHARLLHVAEHYYHFDGVSPINQHARDLIAALKPELERRDVNLPIFWGNRNWHPMLPDTLREMQAGGIQRSLALVLSAYSSYSSCRQYLENIQQARLQVGGQAPVVDKVRGFFNHPGFIAANTARIREALEKMTGEQRQGYFLAFTAHSIPLSMAEHCAYQAQLEETARLIATELGLTDGRWGMAYQSRSGRPTDPWLDPDICDYLRQVSGKGIRDVVVHPVGFLSDHMEVIYDLDQEAQEVAAQIGLCMVRSSAVGTHPTFVAMLGELVEERLRQVHERPALGCYTALPDTCPPDCCPNPRG